MRAVCSRSHLHPFSGLFPAAFEHLSLLGFLDSLCQLRESRDLCLVFLPDHETVLAHRCSCPGVRITWPLKPPHFTYKILWWSASQRLEYMVSKLALSSNYTLWSHPKSSLWFAVRVLTLLTFSWRFSALAFDLLTPYNVSPKRAGPFFLSTAFYLQCQELCRELAHSRSSRMSC